MFNTRYFCKEFLHSEKYLNSRLSAILIRLDVYSPRRSLLLIILMLIITIFLTGNKYIIISIRISKFVSNCTNINITVIRVIIKFYILYIFHILYIFRYKQRNIYTKRFYIVTKYLSWLSVRPISRSRCPTCPSYRSRITEHRCEK